MKFTDYIRDVGYEAIGDIYRILFVTLCVLAAIFLLAVPFLGMTFKVRFYIAFDCLGPPVLGISLNWWWRSYKRRKAERTMPNSLPVPDSSSSPYSDQPGSPVSFTGSVNHDRHDD
jgi:hypothetical protein